MGFRKNRRGSTILEFTLVGVPVIFLLISVVDICIGMFNYETLAHAIKQGARFAVVKGQGCTLNGNTCSVTVGTIATRIANEARGLPASQFNVTLTTASGVATTCTPLTSCLTSSTVWPPAANNDNKPGKTLTVAGRYTFRSIFPMFWPGSPPVREAIFVLPATSTQTIQF